MALGARSRPTREELEAEAAEILGARIALGRPPPEVWEQAARWRAAHPVAAGNWYEAPDPDALARGAVGTDDLTVKVVKLPPEALAAPDPSLCLGLDLQFARKSAQNSS